jgi:hypothetical protein
MQQPVLCCHAPVGIELQPCLYHMRLWVACARIAALQPVLVIANVLLKAPSDLNLCGITTSDVVQREG